MNGDLPVCTFDEAHIRKKRKRYDKKAVVLMLCALCLIGAAAVMILKYDILFSDKPKNDGSDILHDQSGNASDVPDSGSIYSFDMSMVKDGETPVLPVDIVSLHNSYIVAPLDISTSSVLIVATNSSEAYLSHSMSSLAEDALPFGGEYTVGTLGEHIANELCRLGINARYLEVGSSSRRGSSAAARAAVASYLDENDVTLIIDVRRGALIGDGGEILRPITSLGDDILAQMRLVVSQRIDDANERYARAACISNAVSKHCNDAIFIDTVSATLNQDLSSALLTIEIGSCGNTYDEALAAANVLCRAISSVK